MVRINKITAHPSATHPQPHLPTNHAMPPRGAMPRTDKAREVGRFSIKPVRQKKWDPMHQIWNPYAQHGARWDFFLKKCHDLLEKWHHMGSCGPENIRTNYHTVWNVSFGHSKLCRFPSRRWPLSNGACKDTMEDGTYVKRHGGRAKSE